MTPKPHYTIWDAVSVSLALGTRALEEIRNLARTPGPPGQNGSDGKDGKNAAEPDIEMLAAGLLDRLREERLDLDEKLFAARKRYDDLAADLQQKLTQEGPQGEPGPAGEPGRDGTDGISGEARGKYEPAENYRRLDRVFFNGSEWIARQDQPGILPGDGWMLGAQGKRGRPGVGIQAAAVKNYTIMLELDSGKTITVDLRGMFERYHEERGE